MTIPVSYFFFNILCYWYNDWKTQIDNLSEQLLRQADNSKISFFYQTMPGAAPGIFLIFPLMKLSLIIPTIEQILIIFKQSCCISGMEDDNERKKKTEYSSMKSHIKTAQKIYKCREKERKSKNTIFSCKNRSFDRS